MALITLLTDFGLQDEYVGVLKGVILSNNPRAAIVDISHGIDAHDIAAATYALKSSYGFFPEGSVHVAIVDPGVGTERAIIAAQCNRHLFLAPDNGLLVSILRDGSSTTIYRVENEELFRHPVSRTFHGRDIFAPVAAHLSMGLDLKVLGPSVGMDQVQSLTINGPRFLRAKAFEGRVVGLEGRVVAIDRFGNLITNIHCDDMAKLDSRVVTIDIGNHSIAGMVENYAQSRSKSPVAIIGSRGCLEIAINSGNAARTLNMAKGEIVRVKAAT
jgi:S-adenosylmethionine hydrolase